MRSKKEILTVLLGILSILGLGYKLIKPNYFFDASLIITGTTNSLIARALILINIFAMAFFVLAVWRGNQKERLKIAYLLMLVYILTTAVFAVVQKNFNVSDALESEKLSFNTIIYIINIFLIGIFFAIVFLRESNKIRPIPKFSTFLLLGILAEIVTNGTFIYGGRNNYGMKQLIFGLICAMPYITIFIFEYFVVEPSLLKDR